MFVLRNTLIAAIAVTAIGLVSTEIQAATVIPTNLVVGQDFTDAQVLLPGEDLRYDFTVLQNLRIDAFSLSATGNNDGIDVADITFGFTAPPTESFSTIVVTGSAAFGGAFLPGGIFAAGDVFSIFFADGVTNPASVTLSFTTTPVPLPASALLMLSALGGMGLLRWRRKAGNQSVIGQTA